MIDFSKSEFLHLTKLCFSFLADAGIVLYTYYTVCLNKCYGRQKALWFGFLGGSCDVTVYKVKGFF